MAPGPIKRPLKEGFRGERLWGVTVSLFGKILLQRQVKFSLTTKRPINRDGKDIRKSLVGPISSLKGHYVVFEKEFKLISLIFTT